MGKPLALSAKAGVAYALTVFAIGFLLGTARVLLLSLHMESTVAVSVEAPIILTASWYVSSMWMKRLVPRRTPDPFLRVRCDTQKNRIALTSTHNANVGFQAIVSMTSVTEIGRLSPDAVNAWTRPILLKN